ncbi:uncharacterized protein KY384_005080 [Bacidia gigantensis]|uniref:uncharacterized protein n=1 Tax=Bacidia gigantensis TaxID=2732470 RepID=UPI001D04E450|nr:uncharacterized protein KY384_005080 [Bacidia gigantensis]KAG8530577.1 hypothetical protein KY384_005080 [Bacidia gigantensis]
MVQKNMSWSRVRYERKDGMQESLERQEQEEGMEHVLGCRREEARVTGGDTMRKTAGWEKVQGEKESGLQESLDKKELGSTTLAGVQETESHMVVE